MNFRDLFLALSKATISGTVGKWDDAAKQAIDVVKSVGVEMPVEERAWLLIRRAVNRAVFELVGEYADLLTAEPADYRTLVGSLDLALEDLDFSVDDQFFERPSSLSIINGLRAPLAQWLIGFGLEASQASAVAARLGTYFAYGLSSEWRSRPKDYIAITEAINTPFKEASEREAAWYNYNAWLQRQVDERMFDETFSLRQVYVPVRAYYERRRTNDEKEFGLSLRVHTQEIRVLVDLHAEMMNWVTKGDHRDALRVISGGPGSGKSSFAKMFAAACAGTLSFPVLFVPLHRLELTNDLIDAIGNFVVFDHFLTHNPVDPKTGEPRLLLILDGLDELAMQGKMGAEVAQKFVREVEKKVELFNGPNVLRLQALIIGRELTVQANASEFRRHGQILHVLGYKVHESAEWDDPENLRSVDQRDHWWRQYGQITGRKYKGLPDALSRIDLEEVTAQPLLNYLVALGYSRGKIDFTKEFNLNSMYYDLLTAVYERGWAGHQHPAIRGVQQEEFVRVLEEVALAAWHGDGRTTSAKEIEQRCTAAGLGRLLSAFEEGAKAGVTRLLTAFYFRQREQQPSGDRTFEFTHKSFGEYLAARRLLRAAEKIVVQLDRRRNDPDDGWDEREALFHWVQIAGAAEVDVYLLNFVRNELQLRPRSDVEQLQGDFSSLVRSTIKYGMPMERAPIRPAFSDEVRRARNASEALIGVLASCSAVTEQIADVTTQDREALGRWLKMMQGQRTGPPNRVALQSLHHLDLRGYTLDIHDLYGAVLTHSCLAGVALHFANLTHAEMARADLTGALLYNANLSGANLTGANLSGALCQEANLNDAVLSGACLRKADLSDADLRRADLSSADLRGAKMTGVRLAGAKLVDADLRGAVITPQHYQLARRQGAHVDAEPHLTTSQ
ncbi:MAG: pentapeptide repeat-containing protein [Longimicrobiaceae bacterium]